MMVDALGAASIRQRAYTSLIYKLAVLDLIVAQEIAERNLNSKRVDKKMFQILMDAYHSSPVATSTSVGFFGIAAGAIAAINPAVWVAAGTALVAWGITDYFNKGEVD